MQADFQPSSFIPKKTIQNPTLSAGGAVSKGRINAFMLVAGIVFTMTLLGSMGVFLYERYLVSNLASQKESLERARDAFEPRLIEELAKVDTRLDVAGSLLDGHVTISPFFELLGRLTLKTVRFEEFEFTRGVDGLVEVRMKGVAESYRSIALQSELFGDDENIQSPVFSDFKLDELGNVQFSVILSVSNDFLRYANSF